MAYQSTKPDGSMPFPPWAELVASPSSRYLCVAHFVPSCPYTGMYRIQHVVGVEELQVSGVEKRRRRSLSSREYEVLPSILNLHGRNSTALHVLELISGRSLLLSLSPTELHISILEVRMTAMLITLVVLGFHKQQKLENEVWSSSQIVQEWSKTYVQLALPCSSAGPCPLTAANSWAYTAHPLKSSPSIPPKPPN